MEDKKTDIPSTSAQDAPGVSPSSSDLTGSTPASTPESNPPANFNPSRKKLLLVVLVVIIVAVVLGGGYFLWQRSQNKTPQPSPTATPEVSATPDPTADWKTYTNLEKGYSIDYPNNIYTRLICPGEELDLTRKDSFTGRLNFQRCSMNRNRSLDRK